jgi:hypothetical protein
LVCLFYYISYKQTQHKYFCYCHFVCFYFLSNTNKTTQIFCYCHFVCFSYKQTQQVSLYHCDKFGRDSFLGVVHVPLEDVVNQNVADWFPLKQRKPTDKVTNFAVVSISLFDDFVFANSNLFQFIHSLSFVIQSFSLCNSIIQCSLSSVI